MLMRQAPKERWTNVTKGFESEYVKQLDVRYSDDGSVIWSFSGNDIITNYMDGSHTIHDIEMLTLFEAGLLPAWSE
jgi:hypothetical protein